MTQPTIAIVGAGLSGLVLARILQLNGIDATVYEGDASGDIRRQGGSLDIHDDSGQVALRAAGLHDEFLRHVHPQGEHVRVLDRHGKVHVDAAGGGGRPEIDRTVLRQLLLDSLDPGRVAWGHKVTRADRLDDGRFQLTFAAPLPGRSPGSGLVSASSANGLPADRTATAAAHDTPRTVADGTARAVADGTARATADGTTTVVADLLVGADGTWSRVRPLLTTAKPEYSGITHVEISLKGPSETVGTGMIFALGGGRAILGHGGDHIELGASLRVPQDWLATHGVDWSDPVAARAALLDEFADWAPRLTELIRTCDNSFTPRQIFALPPGLRWERVPGVTLVGDAAHVMSPYAGEGANLAMLDAAELAQALLDNPGSIETALTAYETAMFPRAESSAHMSAQGLEMCFSPQAPTELVGFFSAPR